MLVIVAILGASAGSWASTSPVTLRSALVFVPFAVGFAALLSAGAFFSGDSLVLAASQARQVTEQDQPQLMNVVRELSLAANVPMPKVYLIDDTAPNAFATGRDPEHASVAVTIGLLQKLDREELQGVIGHELAHVANYDIRFSLLVGVLVGSIALLADMLARMTIWGGMTGRGSRRGEQRAATTGPRCSSSSSACWWPSWRPSSRGSCRWPSTASASTWPTPRASS